MIDPQRVLLERETVRESMQVQGKQEEYGKFIKLYEEYRQTNDLSPQRLERISQDYCNSPAQHEFADPVTEIVDALLQLPNLPAQEVPTEEEGSCKLDQYELTDPPIDPLDYQEIGNAAGVFDEQVTQTAAAKGFPFLFGQGAKVHRLLGSQMVEKAVERGYREISVPTVVNEASLYRTGGFPTLRSNVYQLTDERRLYLNPTAEIAITNVIADETMEYTDLPLQLVGLSQSYRREPEEAITLYDTVHEFSKVELFKAVAPDQAEEEFEQMIADVKSVLKALGIPYREIVLAESDLGISAAKTHDIEVYLPGSDEWMEVSSCSYLTDFQARRLDAQFIDETGNHEYLHTIHGSGVAVPRVLCALLECYQDSGKSKADLTPIIDRVRKIAPRRSVHR